MREASQECHTQPHFMQMTHSRSAPCYLYIEWLHLHKSTESREHIIGRGGVKWRVPKKPLIHSKSENLNRANCVHSEVLWKWTENTLDAFQGISGQSLVSKPLLSHAVCLPACLNKNEVPGDWRSFGWGLWAQAICFICLCCLFYTDK